MISAQTIVSTIAELLAKTYLDFSVYTQFTPVSFQRPAIYIEIGERKLDGLVGSAVDITAEIKIDVILAANSQGHADKELLANCGNMIIAPLWGAAIGMDEATLLVLDATLGALGNDYAPITLTANYQDNVPTVEEAYSTMENLHFTEDVRYEHQNT